MCDAATTPPAAQFRVKLQQRRVYSQQNTFNNSALLFIIYKYVYSTGTSIVIGTTISFSTTTSYDNYSAKSHQHRHAPHTSYIDHYSISDREVGPRYVTNTYSSIYICCISWCCTITPTSARMRNILVAIVCEALQHKHKRARRGQEKHGDEKN